MRPIVHLEVIVPRILLPVLPAQTTAPTSTQEPAKEEEEQVRIIQTTTNQEVRQSVQVTPSGQRSEGKQFQRFRIQELPIVQEILRLQILRPFLKKSSPATPAFTISDELAFSLDFIEHEEEMSQTTVPLNSAIYQVKLYINAQGMLVGHQIDNSDS